MKFILWTLVWFGLYEISKYSGYVRKDIASEGVQALSATIYLVLWIFLYVTFIQSEQRGGEITMTINDLRNLEQFCLDNNYLYILGWVQSKLNNYVK